MESVADAENSRQQRLVALRAEARRLRRDTILTIKRSSEDPFFANASKTKSAADVDGTTLRDALVGTRTAYGLLSLPTFSEPLNEDDDSGVEDDEIKRILDIELSPLFSKSFMLEYTRLNTIDVADRMGRISELHLLPKKDQIELVRKYLSTSSHAVKQMKKEFPELYSNMLNRESTNTVDERDDWLKSTGMSRSSSQMSINIEDDDESVTLMDDIPSNRYRKKTKETLYDIHYLKDIAQGMHELGTPITISELRALENLELKYMKGGVKLRTDHYFTSLVNDLNDDENKENITSKTKRKNLATDISEDIPLEVTSSQADKMLDTYAEEILETAINQHFQKIGFNPQSLITEVADPFEIEMEESVSQTPRNFRNKKDCQKMRAVEALNIKDTYIEEYLDDYFKENMSIESIKRENYKKKFSRGLHFQISLLKAKLDALHRIFIENKENL